MSQDTPPVWHTHPTARPPGPPKKGLGLIAFLAGLAAVLGFWSGLIGAGIGVAALVLSACAFMRGEKPGFPIAGLILGGIGLALSLTWWAVFGILGWMANPH